MIFEDEKGTKVEISFQNFERILPGSEAGFTLVKLKDGRQVRVQATENEVLEATAEE
jgi:hypothetical protein